MFSQIVKMDFYLPAVILSNEMLEHDFAAWPAQKIEEKTGIRQRHYSAPDQTSLDLGYLAAEKVLTDYDRAKIDFLLFCTQSPDYFLPTSACVLQERLKLGTNIGALDFNLGCSGYIYGLALAQGLISAGSAQCVLLITAETYSKFIHPKDQGNKTIFGDGAAATIIEAFEEDSIGKFVLGTDGKGAANLIVKNGGLRNRVGGNKDEEDIPGDDHLFMNGPEIFNFTIKAVPALVEDVLRKNNQTLETVDYVIFHQANKFMLEHLAKKIKIPKEKFYLDMADTGNTVSSTIPIALKRSLDSGQVKPGQTVLLVGFGVGYSWGGTIIKV